MRRYTDINVKAAAVHLVAPKQGLLRQSVVEITLDSAIHDFLASHVANGIADNNALAGQFKVTGPHRTEGLCRAIISEEDGFLGRSANLAKLLYDASARESGTDARVSDGALVVARCTATDDGTADTPFVALLKLDPNDAFRAEEAEDDRGRPIVRLVQQHDILPTPRERLQKGAFIRDPSDEYDALAVDHQRRGAVVSTFFLDGFLGLEHVYDARERTKRLYQALHRTFNEVGDDLSSAEYARLDQYIQGQVVGGHVNVDTIIDGLPVAEPIKEQFAEALGDALPDKEFDTDAGTAEQLVRRRSFRGDNGLSVTVPGQFYDDMLNVDPPTDADEQFTVTIRTKQWTER